ncbi:MAG: urea ABC transporter permease subunit UrtB [Betaproteobacteria bacterium]|nr:MAG: urea ABC transporter permease subunit UrtB [Betaproteobacteria bacterium]
MLRGFFGKLVLAVAMTVCLTMPARALDAEAVQGLASEELSDRIAAIDAIAAAGDEAALEILELLYNGEVYVTEEGQVILEFDEIVDAVTREPLDPEPDYYDSVIVNNLMRGKLETAIASLSLLSDDRDTRFASAQALERAEDPKLLPVLAKALKSETDPEIRAMLAQTKSVIELASNDPTVRLAAATALADSDQRRVRELLAAKLEKTSEGEFIEPVEEVRLAAEDSMKSIDRRLLLIDYLGRLFSGLSLGSILLLVALGLAITYGLLGVINLAHGEMLMIGAYSTYVTQTIFKNHFPDAFDFYVIAAIPVAFCVAAAVGMLLERTVIRWLYGRPLETLLATWGISLFLIQTVRQIFGAQNVEVANPSWMSGGVEFMNVVMPYNRIFIIIFSFFVLALVALMLARTRLGLFIRGVTQNRTMASCVGVPTGRVDLLAFGLGSGIAGLAGVALSQIGNVGPDLGQAYIIDSFMVVVLGGVGQLAGTVYAALGLGVFSKFIEPHIGAVLTKILVLVLIIAVIQKRPQGLFALRGRAVEA